jgi:ribosomal protein L24E
MPTCNFCKKHYKEPRGLTVYAFDGKAMHYCTGKCQKNMELKRDPKKTNWVKRKKKGKAIQEQKEKLEQIKEETGSENKK